MKDKNGTEYNLNDFILYAREKKIVIFGAGDYGTYIYRKLKRNRIPVYAFCDNDKEKLELMKKKYPVSILENLKSNLEEYYFIIGISKIVIVKAIKSQLYDFGVKLDKMIIPLPDIKSGYFHSMIMFDSEYWIPAVKEQWQYARLHSKQIADYFKTNGLYELIIYENEELKGWLDQDLLNSGVIIKKKINSLEEFTEKEKCDAVVVIDEPNYEVIEEQLLYRTEVTVLSIWDVVRF